MTELGVGWVVVLVLVLVLGLVGVMLAMATTFFNRHA